MIFKKLLHIFNNVTDFKFNKHNLTVGHELYVLSLSFVLLRSEIIIVNPSISWNAFINISTNAWFLITWLLIVLVVNLYIVAKPCISISQFIQNFL